MPEILYTVENLADEIRSQLDEMNQDSIDTDRDILPALYRGTKFAFDILARKYPEPILEPRAFPLTAGVSEYDVPEDVFEDRVLKFEVEIPGASGRSTYREVDRISYRDLTDAETSTTTDIPYYYCLYGRKIRIIPTPTATYSMRMWCIKPIERLVLPQGRITVVNEASNYVIVDAAGSDLTTETDQLGSYVNIVDGQTGEIKCTAQIQLLSDNKVTFRSSPTRSSVLNRDIVDDITDLEIAPDDYICSIEGICVPYFGSPVSNFLIQFAVAELTRKLGGQADSESKVLEKFENQVEKSWVKREQSLRVKKKSRNWPLPIRRWDWTQ